MLHWQLLTVLAMLDSLVMAPQSQCMHGMLRPPIVKKPSANCEQGSARLCSARTQCPGTHVQFVRLMTDGAEVFCID